MSCTTLVTPLAYGAIATGMCCVSSAADGSQYYQPAYQVQSGDTVSGIVENFYGSTDACAIDNLEVFNYIIDGYLQVGQWIVLPLALQQCDGSWVYVFNCLAASLTDVTSSLCNAINSQASGILVGEICGLETCPSSTDDSCCCPKRLIEPRVAA
jgi:hypothetical protein